MGNSLGCEERVSDNLPDPDVIAVDIIEDLQAALEQFAAINADLAEREAA